MMKKIILLSISAAAIVSCTRDYDCACTITQTNSNGTTVSSETTTLIGVTKAQVESSYECVSYDETNVSNGYTSTYNRVCTISEK